LPLKGRRPASATARPRRAWGGRRAEALALARDENLAQVVRRALRAYVRMYIAAGPQQLDLEDAFIAEQRPARPHGRARAGGR
jgi:hypothetical protein